jgi:hypothetical protein
MQSLHERLGALLVAGIPQKGLLLVTDGVANPEQIARFRAIIAGYHGDGDKALCPTAFLVQEGRICGIVA